MIIYFILFIYVCAVVIVYSSMKKTIYADTHVYSNGVELNGRFMNKKLKRALQKESINLDKQLINDLTK